MRENVSPRNISLAASLVAVLVAIIVRLVMGSDYFGFVSVFVPWARP
jgi:hypothetical protein